MRMRFGCLSSTVIDVPDCDRLMMDPHESYALALGKVVENLMSLEMLLRAVLQVLEPGTRAVNLAALKVGDIVSIEPITDYDSLRKLIRRFNASVPPDDRIDENQLTDLRDAIAHGRVFAVTHGGPLTLVKFGRPDKSGKVKVDSMVVLDETWLAGQLRIVFAAIQTVTVVGRHHGIVPS